MRNFNKQVDNCNWSLTPKWRQEHWGHPRGLKDTKFWGESIYFRKQGLDSTSAKSEAFSETWAEAIQAGRSCDSDR